MYYFHHHLSYKNPEGLRYEYKMSGEINEEWKSDDNASATYPSLLPGKYAFSVRACNSNNVCNEPVTYSFVIKKPFYKRLDFIFTMLAEEFGLLGGLLVLLLFLLISCYGLILSFYMVNKFARLLTIGMITTLFLYVFINIGMVMGLLPIVGVPLPFISYGGTALLSSMTAIGLIISCHVLRDVFISRFTDEQN